MNDSAPSIISTADKAAGLYYATVLLVAVPIAMLLRWWSEQP